MQKVYLLLRNNQQTGPYSLDELVQLGLKPMDLIWVEGKSFGWSYPYEVETLQPYVSAPAAPKPAPVPVTAEVSASPAVPKAAPPKNIFVSMPVTAVQPSVPSFSYDPLEQKAEELRKRAQAYAAQSTFPTEEIKTNYARNLNDVEEDYTSWIYQKKTKKKAAFPTKQLMTAGMIGVSLLGLWWVGKTVLSRPVNLPTRVATYNNAATETGTPVNEPAPVNEDVHPVQRPLSKTAAAPKHSTFTTTTKKAKETKSTKVQQPPVISTRTASAPVIISKEPAPQPQENTATAGERKAPTAAEPSRAKKKTLKEILGGLFKKKDSGSPATQEQPRPVENNGNERNSTHREDGTTSTAVDISDQIDIKTNKASDDWMMGVQGLKLTLYNHSTVTLNKAAVEVLYYSEQNSLLDKKTLYFSNIAPRNSQTLAAPDHRMADHVEYRVVSATGG
jgi:hypothetical protein